MTILARATLTMAGHPTMIVTLGTTPDHDPTARGYSHEIVCDRGQDIGYKRTGLYRSETEAWAAWAGSLATSRSRGVTIVED